ncbi:GntR family transcriptional regulator [Cellulosimicrobium marinum]|uniref:GntR family transcriptional regulator n=1 Tax=Cellulosimicrobium marinum TaxID=1638992 RepID=UPI001E5EB45D|nr:GntR family transcriptional regulator [Cellulosimicrobium marinum]MCB7136809.1 GntR family transcriptional regulator [Cellulosimicrobium marinum]
MPADLRVEIDLDAPDPPYAQIRAQVVAHVAAGHLSPGDRLPPIRALASDLGLAAGTVARAYRELEAAGVVVTRRRAGTVVADGVTPSDVDARRAARDLVATARHSGLDDATVLDLVRTALAQDPDPTS